MDTRYLLRPDITGSFDQRQAACKADYPGGPGLAVIHSDGDMELANTACTAGMCLLGVRWADDEWKWVDGQTLGWDGRSGGYHQWGPGQPEKTSQNDHEETTAALWGWEWHDAGSLDSPSGTTLCQASSPEHIELLPGIDWEMQNCRLEKDWQTLVSEFVKEKEEHASMTYPSHVTGGLGKLMKIDDMEVWLCYRGNLICALLFVRHCDIVSCDGEILIRSFMTMTHQTMNARREPTTCVGYILSNRKRGCPGPPTTIFNSSGPPHLGAQHGVTKALGATATPTVCVRVQMIHAVDKKRRKVRTDRISCVACAFALFCLLKRRSQAFVENGGPTMLRLGWTHVTGWTSSGCRQAVGSRFLPSQVARASDLSTAAVCWCAGMESASIELHLDATGCDRFVCFEKTLRFSLACSAPRGEAWLSASAPSGCRVGPSATKSRRQKMAWQSVPNGAQMPMTTSATVLQSLLASTRSLGLHARHYPNQVQDSLCCDRAGVASVSMTSHLSSTI